MVKASPHPVANQPALRNNKLVTPDDYSYNARYLLACAAHRIDPPRWHDEDVKENQQVIDFMNRLDLTVIPDVKAFIQAKIEDPKSFRTSIEVITPGKTYSAISRHPKGACHLEELKITDEELLSKFTANCSKKMDLEKATMIGQAIYKLDTMQNVAELMNRFNI